VFPLHIILRQTLLKGVWGYKSVSGSVLLSRRFQREDPNVDKRCKVTLFLSKKEELTKNKAYSKLPENAGYQRGSRQKLWFKRRYQQTNRQRARRLEEETIRDRADSHRDRMCRETDGTRDKDFKIKRETMKEKPKTGTILELCWVSSSDILHPCLVTQKLSAVLPSPCTNLSWRTCIYSIITCHLADAFIQSDL